MENLICINNKFDGSSFVEKFFLFLDVQSKDTLRTYRNGIANFMNYLKDNHITTPNRNDVVDWKANLKRTSSTSTVNTYLVSVKALFNFLEMYELYPNISKYVKALNSSYVPKKNILTEEQIQTIYNSLSDKRDKAIFSLMITTGLRGIEVANAKIENIKEINGEYCLFIKGKGHTEEDDFVKLSNVVLDNILDYIGDRKEGYIFLSTSNHNSGKGITVLTVRRIVKNILKKCNIKDDTLSSHSLRRSFSCVAYNNGADIYSIQQILRHSSVATTERYIKQADRYNNKTEQTVSNIMLGENL